MIFTIITLFRYLLYMALMSPSLEHKEDQGHMIEYILQLSHFDLLVQRVNLEK